MLLADTMAIFFVIVGLLIAFPSIWLLCLGLWPDFVDASSNAVEHGILKSFLIGIPITALSIFIIVVVGKLPASFGQIGGILSFSALLLFAESGVSGLAQALGKRLFFASGHNKGDSWKATLRGGAVLVLSYLLPLLGWFLILPASIIIGAGSATRACFRSRKKGERAGRKTELSNTKADSLQAENGNKNNQEDAAEQTTATENGG